MRKIITAFLLMLISFFSFSQLTDTTFIPLPSRREVIKEFKFENNNAEGFASVVPPINSPDRWHRKKISQVRILNPSEQDEGTIRASSSSEQRKLLVVRSPIIDIPSIPFLRQNKSLHVLSILHECAFDAGDTPAKITLHFLDSGYKYDYYVNTDSSLGVRIPFDFEKDGFKWSGTRMRIELSFWTKPNTYWMIRDITLLKYNYDTPFIRPLGSRSGSSGTGTSGPTGPRN